MPDKQKVLNGRAAVALYRAFHTKLHSGKWHRGIPSAHTPLLEKMLVDLKEQGFNSLNEFFVASKELDETEKMKWQ